MLTKISAFFTAFLVLLGSFSLIAEPKITEACSGAELMAMQGIIEKKDLSDEVFAFDIGGFSYEERLTAIALQGIVAQKSPCVYLITCGADRDYLAEIEASGKTVHYEKYTLAQMIEKFISNLDSHVVILNANDFLKTIQENVPHKDAMPD